MDPRDLVMKTAVGQAEVVERAQSLAPKLRRLLIMLDGTRSVAELEQIFAPLGNVRDMLTELGNRGLISVRTLRAPEPQAPRAPVPLPPGTAQQQFPPREPAFAPPSAAAPPEPEWLQPAQMPMAPAPARQPPPLSNAYMAPQAPRAVPPPQLQPQFASAPAPRTPPGPPGPLAFESRPSEPAYEPNRYAAPPRTRIAAFPSGLPFEPAAPVAPAPTHDIEFAQLKAAIRGHLTGVLGSDEALIDAKLDAVADRVQLRSFLAGVEKVLSTYGGIRVSRKFRDRFEAHF